MRKLSRLGKMSCGVGGLPSMGLMTSEWLDSLRGRALRRRLWFRVLNKLERGIMSLTIRCVDVIKSSRLALIIGRLVCKVLKACRSRFLMQVVRTGQDLADRIIRIAASWGVEEAYSWKGDKDFIRYLGVNAVNGIPGWRGVS